jgi:flagellar basal body-associated protein FliL
MKTKYWVMIVVGVILVGAITYYFMRKNKKTKEVKNAKNESKVINKRKPYYTEEGMGNFNINDDISDIVTGSNTFSQYSRTNLQNVTATRKPKPKPQKPFIITTSSKEALNRKPNITTYESSKDTIASSVASRN